MGFFEKELIVNQAHDPFAVIAGFHGKTDTYQ
jgi:hypothetical protein